MSTLDTLIEIRTALQGATDGQHPALHKLDRMIAAMIRVNVFELRDQSIALSDVVHEDDVVQLSHLLDQLVVGRVGLAGGGAQTAYIVERI